MRQFRNSEIGIRIGPVAIFGVALALSVVAAPLIADAQQPGNVPRIGFLSPGNATSSPTETFRQGLRDLGYMDGQNLVVEYRWADGDIARLSALAAELVRLRVDVLVAATNAAALAARQATSTIPIVFAASSDPVGTGLVANLAHPGGNITGLSLVTPELSGKRLQFLRETLPQLGRVALLWDAGNVGMADRVRETEAAADSLEFALTSNGCAISPASTTPLPPSLRRAPTPSCTTVSPSRGTTGSGTWRSRRAATPSNTRWQRRCFLFFCFSLSIHMLEENPLSRQIGRHPARQDPSPKWKRTVDNAQWTHFRIIGYKRRRNHVKPLACARLRPSFLFFPRNLLIGDCHPSEPDLPKEPLGSEGSSRPGKTFDLFAKKLPLLAHHLLLIIPFL